MTERWCVRFSYAQSLSNKTWVSFPNYTRQYTIRLKKKNEANKKRKELFEGGFFIECLHFQLWTQLKLHTVQQVFNFAHSLWKEQTFYVKSNWSVSSDTSTLSNKIGSWILLKCSENWKLLCCRAKQSPGLSRKLKIAQARKV